MCGTQLASTTPLMKKIADTAARERTGSSFCPGGGSEASVETRMAV
jgi:hypothetical protein